MRLIRTVWNWEVAMWRSLYLWARRKPRHPLAEGETPFAYDGIIAPVLCTFLVMSVIEIPILDLLLKYALGWDEARGVLLIIGIWGVFWCLGLIASMKVHPHTVGPSGIRVRSGHGIDFPIPWEVVESVTKGIRSLEGNKTIQVDGETLMVTAGSQTNVDVRLTTPTLLAPHHEPVTEVRLHADDATGFVRAARARLGAPAL